MHRLPARILWSTRPAMHTCMHALIHPVDPPLHEYVCMCRQAAAALTEQRALAAQQQSAATAQRDAAAARLAALEKEQEARAAKAPP